jgi:hypothetical protein
MKRKQDKVNTKYQGNYTVKAMNHWLIQTKLLVDKGSNKLENIF